MRKTAVVLIALFLSATPAFAKVKVVATLQWIGSVAGEIGKGQVEVATLVKPNQDPHMVEARPSMILATRKADILMYNGLDLEIGYLPVLIESSRNPNIQPGKPGNFDAPISSPFWRSRSRSTGAWATFTRWATRIISILPAAFFPLRKGWPTPCRRSTRPMQLRTRPTLLVPGEGSGEDRRSGAAFR